MKAYKQRLIDNIIIDFVRKRGGIVHGRKSLNERLPKPLYKKTTDFDVFMNKPKINARRLEKNLDELHRTNLFKKNQFYVKKGKHEGTYKIKNNMGTRTLDDDKTVADITKPTERIPHEKAFDGLKFTRISHLKKKLLKTTRDPSQSFRWKKDRDTLRAIKKLEKSIWT